MKYHLLMRGALLLLLCHSLSAAIPLEDLGEFTIVPSIDRSAPSQRIYDGAALLRQLPSRISSIPNELEQKIINSLLSYRDSISQGINQVQTASLTLQGASQTIEASSAPLPIKKELQEAINSLQTAFPRIEQALRELQKGIEQSTGTSTHNLLEEIKSTVQNITSTLTSPKKDFMDRFIPKSLPDRLDTLAKILSSVGA